MPNFNKIMLMGNLTRDPEMRYTSNNTPVVRFGMAVNREWKDRNSGEKREETLFVDCSAFARTAEVINQYFNKGKPIFVEGRLKLDRWQDKEGNNRSKHEVIVESFQFLEGRGGGSDGGGRSDRNSSQPEQSGDDYHQPVEEQDIPF